jgi:hypothetical protein
MILGRFSSHPCLFRSRPRIAANEPVGEVIDTRSYGMAESLASDG